MHALFRVHGGSLENEGEEHDPSTWNSTCTQSMQSFKAAVRWIAAHGVRTSEEWKLQTSYSRANRLSALGISNKHAAVRGMPNLTQKQAEAVANLIMHERGLLHKKKDKASWAAQHLQVISRPYCFKGTLMKIKKDLLLENWQKPKEESLMPIMDHDTKMLNFFPSLRRLEEVYCPTCGHGATTMKGKSKVSDLNSNVRCKRCQQSCKSKIWQCSCGEPWPKCETHRRQLIQKQTVVPKKRRQVDLIKKIGTNRPLPKRKDDWKKLTTSKRKL